MFYYKVILRYKNRQINTKIEKEVVKMNKRKKRMRLLNMSIIASIGLSLFSPMQYVQASEVENTVFINEIESNDTVTDIDWIEIINTGNSDVDISGWFVTDDKGLERLADNEEWRIEDGTVLKAGEILVVEHDVVLGNLSLGKNDTVSLYDSSEYVIGFVYLYRSCSWVHIQGFQMVRENLLIRNQPKVS